MTLFSSTLTDSYLMRLRFRKCQTVQKLGFTEPAFLLTRITGWNNELTPFFSFYRLRKLKFPQYFGNSAIGNESSASWKFWIKFTFGQGLLMPNLQATFTWKWRIGDWIVTHSGNFRYWPKSIKRNTPSPRHKPWQMCVSSGRFLMKDNESVYCLFSFTQ